MPAIIAASIPTGFALLPQAVVCSAQSRGFHEASQARFRRARRSADGHRRAWHKALVHDEDTDEVSSAEDEQANRNFYARAFSEWAKGNLAGDAQAIFDAVTA